MLNNEIDDIEQLIRKRHKKKNIKNQIPYAIILLIIVLIISIVFWESNHKYTFCWILGIIIGVILRYSRFCFAGVFRDPFLTGNTKLFRAMLIGLMISTVGFSIIQYLYIKQYNINIKYIPGAIDSAGIHVAIGAFMFGIGMILAGGCSSGVLMRIGEGHALQWIVLLGFFIGTTLGARDYNFWHKYIIRYSKVIYLPQYIDLKIVTIVQVITLGIMYKIAVWYENTHNN